MVTKVVIKDNKNSPIRYLSKLKAFTMNELGESVILLLILITMTGGSTDGFLLMRLKKNILVQFVKLNL